MQTHNVDLRSSLLLILRDAERKENIDNLFLKFLLDHILNHLKCSVK